MAETTAVQPSSAPNESSWVPTLPMTASSASRPASMSLAALHEDRLRRDYGPSGLPARSFRWPRLFP